MNPNFFNLSERRKKKGNILADLLSEKPTEGIVTKKELVALNKFIESASSHNTPTQSNIQAESVKKETADGRKKQKKSMKKTTCYLSRKNVTKLDKVTIKLQALGKGKGNISTISRSSIIDQALTLLLENLETRES